MPCSQRVFYPVSHKKEPGELTLPGKDVMINYSGIYIESPKPD